MNVNECNILTNEFGEFEGDVMELNNPGVIGMTTKNFFEVVEVVDDLLI